MTDPDTILTTLKQVKYELSLLQTKLSNVIAEVAKLPQTPREQHRCPHCAGEPWPSKNSLEVHLHNAHNGPVPEHYLTAERLAGHKTA